jgi:poly(3-hydroxybutyrate) depolymerase
MMMARRRYKAVVAAVLPLVAAIAIGSVWNDALTVSAESTARSTFFLVSFDEVTSCTLDDADKCDKWPAAGDGKVYLYTLEESFGSTGKYKRFFHVFVPSGIEGPAPLAVVLHGGYLSGMKLFGMLPFHTWAAGHQTTWQKNTESCRATTDGSNPLHSSVDFKTADGKACDPQEMTTNAPTKFVVVYPSGLVDRKRCLLKDKNVCQTNADCPGLLNTCRGQSPTEVITAKSTCHWEDGRSASPNWGLDSTNPADETQYRDDVGFINYILETLLQPSQEMPAVSRVVLGGISNGGIMAQRVACHAGDPLYPAVGNISSLMVNVAAMPRNTYDGVLNRQKCEPRRPLRVIYTVGTGIPTPDCNVYGCDEPTVDGDGIIAYGSPGQRHNVNSPSLGAIVSHKESIGRWAQTNAGLSGRTVPEAVVDNIGFFTTRSKISFGSDFPESDVVGYVTNGGTHVMNSYLGDMDVFETMLKFSLPGEAKNTDLTLNGFPHKFDAFAPSSSTPRYGLVFLHGGGGTKEGAEDALKLTLQWAEDNSVVVVVPQGQAVQTCCKFIHHIYVGFKNRYISTQSLSFPTTS